MGTSNLFNAASSVKEVRDVTAGYTLEILGYFFPTDEVKELQAQYEAGTADTEIPSGAAAVNFEAVTPETKTALLIAQAAERTARLADLGEQFAAGHTTFVNAGEAPDFAKNGGKPLTSDDFQWVGSDKDAPELQHAQGVMMAAQAYLNNELESISEDISNPSFPASISQGYEAADGFRAKAAELYNLSATLLSNEGHEDIATTLIAAGNAVSGEINDHATTSTPSETASEILRLRRLTATDAIISGVNVSLSDEYIAAMQKAISLSSKIDVSPAGPAPDQPKIDPQ